MRAQCHFWQLVMRCLCQVIACQLAGQAVAHRRNPAGTPALQCRYRQLLLSYYCTSRLKEFNLESHFITATRNLNAVSSGANASITCIIDYGAVLVLVNGTGSGPGLRVGCDFQWQWQCQPDSECGGGRFLFVL